MGPHLAGIEEEVAVERHAAARVDIDLGHPSTDAVRIELAVPGRVEAVGDVDALSVAADLDHLRSAVDRLPRLAWVWRTAGNAAKTDRAHFHRVKRISDVVLDELSGAPARHVEKAIVNRQIDIGYERCDGLETLEERRQLFRVRRFGGNLDHSLHRPRTRSGVPVPQPDRRRQVLQRQDDAGESVGASWIVGRPQFEHHLLFGAEIELLQMTPSAQVPHVQAASVLAREQELGVDAVLHHVGCAPRARHHRVEAEVPPHVVGQFLRSAIELPATAYVKRFRIEDERAARTVSVERAKRAHVDAFRSAVHRVRRGIAGVPGERLSLDRLDDPRLPGVGLRVEDVDARRVDTRHHEITSLHVRMRRVRAQAGAAGVPSEVVQFITGMRHLGLADETAVRLRAGIDVDDTDRVGSPRARRIDEREVGVGLGRRLRRHRRRRIERRVRGQHRHRLPPESQIVAKAMVHRASPWTNDSDAGLLARDPGFA